MIPNGKRECDEIPSASKKAHHAENLNIRLWYGLGIPLLRDKAGMYILKFVGNARTVMRLSATIKRTKSCTTKLELLCTLHHFHMKIRLLFGAVSKLLPDLLSVMR